LTHFIIFILTRILVLFCLINLASATPHGTPFLVAENGTTAAAREQAATQQQQESKPEAAAAALPDCPIHKHFITEWQIKPIPFTQQSCQAVFAWRRTGTVKLKTASFASRATEITMKCWT
jgi:hypothetical protein